MRYFKKAVITTILPLIICQSEAVIYNCAINNNKVQNKSHSEGIMSDIKVEVFSISLCSFSVNQYCWINHINKAGTIPKNIKKSIVIGFANNFTSPFIPTEEVS